MRRLSKNITLEECHQFKAEHPALNRKSLRAKDSAMYYAMKRLNVLDELYPYLHKYQRDITVEDCIKFKEEHPDLLRDDVYKEYGIYYKAMKTLGVIDELYPISFVPLKNISAEDCKVFKQEHPNLSRVELRKQFWPYYKATKHYNLLDDLYPSRMYERKYIAQQLIDIARQYKSRKQLHKERNDIYIAIQKYGIAKEAYAHMKRLGDDKHKLIYAFEFPDNSVYVGLTYNLALRSHNHLYDTRRTSSVREHIEKTGLQPELKQLTELLDVEEAARMEGEYVEKYRSEGWTILNKVKTGSVGTVHNRRRVAKEEILRIAREGYPIKVIMSRTGATERFVGNVLRNEGIDAYRLNDIPVEIVDKQGNIVRTFPSIQEAKAHYDIGYHFGMKSLNSRLKHLKTGYTARYNEEKYIMIHGRKYGEKK